jgi:hypothetical protein
MIDREHKIARLNWEIVRCAIEWRKTHRPKMERAEVYAYKKLISAIDARQEFTISDAQTDLPLPGGASYSNEGEG